MDWILYNKYFYHERVRISQFRNVLPLVRKANLHEMHFKNPVNSRILIHSKLIHEI